MIHRCEHCRKVILGPEIPLRHWPRKLLSYFRNDPMMREYNTLREPGTFRYTVITRYHKSGGKVFHHNCWGHFLREVGE